MKRYVVGIREVWVHCVTVDAESPEDAKQKAADGYPASHVETEDRTEYSHSLNRDLWTVEEIEP